MWHHMCRWDLNCLFRISTLHFQRPPGNRWHRSLRKIHSSAPHKVDLMPREPVYYGSYLALDELLGAKRLESERSGRRAHDEMLFIIVHQAYELWFKQILWELEAVVRIFDDVAVRERDVARAVAQLGRIGKVQHLILGQIGGREARAPLALHDFRAVL